ncbi:glycosyltransferase [Aliivibrio finisterrensis]|uniref:Glycosyltransferase n=1 Tax=Aliivibrio finisterrensis TaxID=511998 RepID=A0A4Q5KG83_9GAMM|nr:glycosyltransferase [Aliivibrio finisterrensis]RYU44042.1 glycosyltransferase [Aliivibrio finisterrensis]
MIAHIIPSLEFGGAERMLLKLCLCDKKNNIVFYFKTGPILSDLNKQGVKSFKINSFIDLCRVLFRLNLRSNLVVNCWLYKSCIFGGFIKILNSSIPVYFNHRNSLDCKNKYGMKRRFVLYLVYKLSKYVDGVIYNSESGYKTYQIKYNQCTNQIVLPNGFDDQIFMPGNRSKLGDFRHNLGINDYELVFVCSGRNHSVKRYDIIIEAFSKFNEKINNKAKLLICGTDTKNLKTIIPDFCRDSIILVGEVTNMIKYYQISDYLLLYSDTEGFPNVVGEAMLCGLPAIVSDVGDCRKLVEDTGWVGNSGDVLNLVSILYSAYNVSSIEYRNRSDRAVEIITKKYSINNIYEKYLRFFYAS